MLCPRIMEHTCSKAEAVIVDAVLLYIKSLPWKQPKSMRGFDVLPSEPFVIVGIDFCSFVPNFICGISHWKNTLKKCSDQLSRLFELANE